MVSALDDAWCLLLPSRSEGTPRVILEALCRGRAVIGGRVGGIPDAVRDAENGFLVEPADVAGIADALVRLLSDRALAERLGAQALEDSRAVALHRRRSTPSSVAALVAARRVLKPRVLIVGRTRYRLPSRRALRAPKFDALSEVLELRVAREPGRRDGGRTSASGSPVPAAGGSTGSPSTCALPFPRCARELRGVPARTPCSRRARSETAARPARAGGSPASPR